MNLTNKLGEFRKNDVEKEVSVAGWVSTKRNLGELIFIDLRDKSGISQIVIQKDNPSYNIANKVKNEYVLHIKGIVKERSSINLNIPTGEIEIIAKEIYIVNECEPLPLQIVEDLDASEDTRLKYRYLDLRRKSVLDNLLLRHKIVKYINDFLDENEFINIETPILTKSTPEGARDYLVPSRVNKDTCYALPQSPQMYKNLLMIGGIERYYQIVKCFRDEDLRADRQPEFTQVDMEMSFMSEEEIRNLVEKMIKHVVLKTKGIEIKEDFPIMPYEIAMRDYGIDKPDIRFDLKLKDVTHIFEKSDFKVFSEANMIKAIKVENKASEMSRKVIDSLEKVAKDNSAKGLAWLKKEENFTGPIAKFLTDAELLKLTEELSVNSNDLLLFVADKESVVNQSLAAVRNKLGKDLALYNPEELNFLWVVDWPMFEYDEELKRYFAVHHPFTMPKDEKFVQDELLSTKAQAYDIVLNGYELGGGSIRINNTNLQHEMFKHLGMSDSEINEDFGFLVDAYKYGAPYHGGIALGLDRFVMLLAGTESIRDVIAFPKNAKARELMIDSPSTVSEEQLKELNMKWREDEEG